MDTKALLIALIEDEGKPCPSDTILEFYIDKAKNVIMKKCWLTLDDYNNYGLINQTAELAKHYYLNKKNIGISQKTSGGIQQSYINEDIPKPILATLPVSKIMSF